MSRAAEAQPARPGWAYGAGEWYAVLGAGTAVLLPPGQRERATSLWAVVDDGAGFEALLEALLARGLSELASFAVLALEGAEDDTSSAETLRVLVRGDASVTCETDAGPVVLDGREAGTWTERRLGGVRGIRVALAAAAGQPPAGGRADEPSAHVLGSAMVRAGWVACPPGAAGLRGAWGAAPPITEPEPVSPEPVEPSPVPPPPPGPVPSEPEPETEPSPAAAPSAAGRRGRARLLLSPGREVEVEGIVLLGRDPEARPGGGPGRGPGEPRLVQVTSPQQEISATHLEVRPAAAGDEGVAVVTDLGSTNGTILMWPTSRSESLQPWVPVAVPAGAVLDLGDGVTVEVAGA